MPGSAHHFLLSGKKAAAIVAHQISAIGVNWSAVCDEAGLAKLAGDVRNQNGLNFYMLLSERKKRWDG